MNSDSSSRMARCLYINATWILFIYFTTWGLSQMLPSFFSALKMLEEKEICPLGRYVRKRHKVLGIIKSQAVHAYTWYVRLHVVCSLFKQYEPSWPCCIRPLGKNHLSLRIASNSSNHSFLDFSGLLWECLATAEWLPPGISREWVGKA